jgi:hypothetical protein
MSLDGPLSPLASITCLNRTCEALYVNVVKKWPCAPLIPAAVLRGKSSRQFIGCRIAGLPLLSGCSMLRSHLAEHATEPSCKA